MGLNGTVMKAHGSAREKAIMNAIRVTTETVEHQINKAITDELQRANERLAATKTDVPTPVSP